MYDFYFGATSDVIENETKFLLSVKRMLPKWTNSIPDSEFLAICNLLEEAGREAKKAGRPFVAVETGAGASTLAFIWYAIKYEGKAYSWEMNQEKNSLLRTVANESICNVVRKNIHDHWQPVAFSSLDPHLGLSVLNELTDHLDVFFHDSYHTWQTVIGEYEKIMPLLVEGSVAGMDDANYRYIKTNTGYINLFRKKIGLDSIAEEEGNLGEPFYAKLEQYLSEHWSTLTPLNEQFQKDVKDDLYWPYYDSELQIRNDAGIEYLDAVDNRFAAWKLSGKRD